MKVAVNDTVKSGVAILETVNRTLLSPLAAMSSIENLVSETDLQEIISKSGVEYNEIINIIVKNYSTELVGYLGEHLKLEIVLSWGRDQKILKFFVKCIPRFDKLKADYIRKCGFFKKEYTMLKEVFKGVGVDEDENKWRPKVFLLKEDVCVFEDLVDKGYKTPPQEHVLSKAAIEAVIKSMAKMHSTSIIYEEQKSLLNDRRYCLWNDYKHVLQEPKQGHNWRNAGMKVVKEYLKLFSKYKNTDKFIERIDNIIPKLYDHTWTLMEPSTKYKNVIIHRDIWTNNVFLKAKEDGSYHAILIDYQTVLYCPPVADIASFLYFNTNCSFRKKHLNELLNLYYAVLREELNTKSIPVESFISKEELTESYEEYILFGLTQAALIVPLIAMNNESRKALFGNPETYERVNEVDRSQEIISIANSDENFRCRILDIFDEIVERYVLTKNE